jgi:hypothetical protein
MVLSYLECQRMGIREEIDSVLALQGEYSSANTPAMARRGRLIRDEIPQSLALIAAPLAAATGLAAHDFLIEGRDGTGRKSEIPWVRFASAANSPSATTGWYVVWLFRRDGAGVYLTLAHGSAQFHAGSLVVRSDEELAELMRWSRTALAPDLSRQQRLVRQVNLVSRASLALGYEKSCVTAFYYAVESLPSDSEIQQDLLTMAALLGKLYHAERLGQTPLSASPEIRDAEAAIDEIASPGLVRGCQGLALTAPERLAVELRAMTLASRHLASLGYVVTDVSSSESFDLLATRAQEALSVEVKGTTGGLGEILLTANEVDLHRRISPANALLVVHSIVLNGSGAAPVASGGELRAWLPWLLDESRLRGITFAYQLEPSR